MAIASYLIYPKKELTEVMEDYPDFYPRKPVVWRFDEHPHTLPIHRELGYIPRIKLVFLASLARQINPALDWRNLQRIVAVLFGTPPIFSVKNFDKWWTIQHVPPARQHPDEVLMLKSEHFEAIHKDEVHDNLIKGFIEVLDKLNSLPKGSEERERILDMIFGRFTKTVK